MKPSFVTLFKRGRYYRQAGLPANEDDEETTKARKELERYAASAIAFCFKHDSDFKRDFWETICKQSGDPNFSDLETVTIEVEPANWADLLIRSKSADACYAHVIECKVNANLEPHQDPRKDAFSLQSSKKQEKDGYGWCMVNDRDLDKQSVKLRYIVLGFPENLGLPRTHPKRPIQLSQRHWSELEHNVQATPMVDDLFDSLGELGVGELATRRFQSMKIENGLHNVGNVWEVLQQIADEMKFRAKIHAYPNEEGGSGIGIYVDVKQAEHTPLQKVMQAFNLESIWFGYEAFPNVTPYPVIWIYCKNLKHAKEISKKLPHGEEKEDDGRPCVFLKMKEISMIAEDHRDWFRKTVKELEKQIQP